MEKRTGGGRLKRIPAFLQTRDPNFTQELFGAQPAPPESGLPGAIRRESKRRLGDYVLVARLSDDALGTVYRAIHVREGRFARLRVLESPELTRAAICRAISRMEPVARKRSVHPPGRRETLAMADGKPYLAWRETNGWTLDAVLESAYLRGSPIPIDGALRIARRAAAALEHVGSSAAEGEPDHRGVLWPAFVTISHKAADCARSFG